MSDKTLYFGYGSNLDREDWNKWCNERGHDPSGLVELGPAWLPEYQMMFHYYSHGRGGGAADVVHVGPGFAVPGALFEMDEEALVAMDKKEGHPNYYERKNVHVCLAGGRVVEALTYTVVERKILEEHQPPTEEYANLISNGLERLGLPTYFLEAAATNRLLSDGLPQLFTYGTLMQGESRSAALNAHPHRMLGSASVVGGLVDLGDFPGLVHEESSIVHGEFYFIEDIAKLIGYLDRIEGFYGYGHDKSLFVRSIIKVEIGGSRQWAWTYIYNGERGKEIPSGDWHERERY